MPSTNSSPVSDAAKLAESGAARIIIFVLVAFALGLVCGGYGYYRQTQKRAVHIEPAAASTLTDSTRAILQRLDVPVEVHFYAPSTPADLPETLIAFAGRVQQLLAEYERVGDGKIRLVQSDPALNSSAKAAAGAEGLLPFSGNNGEICYLGISIAQGGRKETIPQLSPDWEAALESDLSRAIARVATSIAAPVASAVQVSATPSPIDQALTEELLRTIPDLESRSFDDAAKILRESALVEFTAAVRAMQSKVQETERELAAAQASRSEADQQAAMQQLQQVQAAESKKLSEITAQLQARLQVLERLKGVNRSRPK